MWFRLESLKLVINPSFWLWRNAPFSLHTTYSHIQVLYSHVLILYQATDTKLEWWKVLNHFVIEDKYAYTFNYEIKTPKILLLN